MKSFGSFVAAPALWLAYTKAIHIGPREDAFSCPSPTSLMATNVTLGGKVIGFESLSCDGFVYPNVINNFSIAEPYGQCGGMGFSGPSICPSGFFCEAWNPFYYQCIALPATSASSTIVKTSPPTTISSSPTSTPTPPPTTNVCNQLCSNTCGSLGDLPPISEDCAAIFDSVLILNGSITPTFDVPPNSIQQLTFETCRVFFENLSTTKTVTFCWTALANTASAAGTLCFPPTQPVNSLGLCTADSGLWAVGIAHS